jgi:hypothetical protein
MCKNIFEYGSNIFAVIMAIAGKDGMILSTQEEKVA